MNNINRILCGVAALLAAAGATYAQSKDTDDVKPITELNRITGTKLVDAKVVQIMHNPKHAKRVVALGLKVAKEEKNGLRYNAAFVLATIASRLKDIKSSEIFYRICMKQAAKLQSPRRLLATYSGLIELFYDNKMYKESADVCRELLELQTDDGKPREVHFLRSGPLGELTYRVTGRFNTARLLDPLVERMLIQAITKQGKYAAALRMIDRMLETSDDWMQRQLKGMVLREAGNYKQAAEVYEDVLDRVHRDLRLGKDDRQYYVNRFRYVLSNIYSDMKKIDLAAKHLEALIDANPDNPGYYNDLGYTWANNDMHLEKAEKMIRKALDLDRKQRKKNPNLSPAEDRDNGAYLDSLGWVLYKRKKYKEARKYLLEAVTDKRTQHIEIYDHLGDVYVALGKNKAALRAWRQGIAVCGNSHKELEIKESIQKKIKKLEAK